MLELVKHLNICVLEGTMLPKKNRKPVKHAPQVTSVRIQDSMQHQFVRLAIIAPHISHSLLMRLLHQIQFLTLVILTERFHARLEPIGSPLVPQLVTLRLQIAKIVIQECTVTKKVFKLHRQMNVQPVSSVLKPPLTSILMPQWQLLTMDHALQAITAE